MRGAIALSVVAGLVVVARPGFAGAPADPVAGSPCLVKDPFRSWCPE